MGTFLGKAFNTYFKRILQFGHSGNNGTPTSTTSIQAGDGVATSISLSDDVLQVQPQNDNGDSLLVKSQGGSNILAVDTTNSKVLVNRGQIAANTQYAYFGINGSQASSSTFAANTHYPLAFNHGGWDVGFIGSFLPIFGTGTDPAITFTTADANSDRAAELVPVMWRVPDDITIDEIKHLEGADNATGDVTRMHLMSYTFTSGSTSALSSGAVVANTSADNTNAGSEQAYLKDWTILEDAADVDAGKVLLCFFRSDSTASDYSISVTIKYHLR